MTDAATNAHISTKNKVFKPSSKKQYNTANTAAKHSDMTANAVDIDKLLRTFDEFSIILPLHRL